MPKSEIFSTQMIILAIFGLIMVGKSASSEQLIPFRPTFHEPLSSKLAEKIAQSLEMSLTKPPKTSLIPMLLEMEK